MAMARTPELPLPPIPPIHDVERRLEDLRKECIESNLQIRRDDMWIVLDVLEGDSIANWFGACGEILVIRQVPMEVIPLMIRSAKCNK